MTGHRLVVEAGPGVVRRLCCGAGQVDADAAAALEWIDDPVALVDGQPVAVDALWRRVLRALAGPDRHSGMLLIHPTWWSTARIALVAGAARTLASDVVIRSRSQQLSTAGAAVVIEIAAALVAITAAGTVAEPRIGSPRAVADSVARRAAALTRGAGATVLIDPPDGVAGADALAALIAERLAAAAPEAIVQLGDDTRLVESASPAAPAVAQPAGERRPRRIPALLLAAAAAGAVVLGMGLWPRRADAPVGTEAATTFLVEGRVALQVPAQWPVRRVTTGPGSARVEVTSPTDPQVVLHVTQSLLPGGSLNAAAESLQQAITRANAAEPADVFIGFTPSGQRAGRPAATYREVRPGHHIDWTLLVDGAVRISIGCQSRPGGADTVRAVCDQAVRSARALH